MEKMFGDIQQRLNEVQQLDSDDSQILNKGGILFPFHEMFFLKACVQIFKIDTCDLKRGNITSLPLFQILWKYQVWGISSGSFSWSLYYMVYII